MTDESDINIEDDAANTLAVSDKLRKRFGLPALLGAMFLSSAFGAGAIGLISHFNKTPQIDLAPLQAQMETVRSEAQNLTSENKTLKAQIARLERDMKNRPAPVAIDVKPLEKRVQALEQAEPHDINPEVLSRLEALQNEGSQALDLSDILARLDDLENCSAIESSIDKPAVKADMNRMMAFPSGEVIARLEKPDGWLKKSLKKHISVQSEDNPRYLVELINMHIEAGDIEAAIAAFEKLPPDAKAAGQAWRESLKR